MQATKQAVGRNPSQTQGKKPKTKKHEIKSTENSPHLAQARRPVARRAKKQRGKSTHKDTLEGWMADKGGGEQNGVWREEEGGLASSESSSAGDERRIERRGTAGMLEWKRRIFSKTDEWMSCGLRRIKRAPLVPQFFLGGGRGRRLLLQYRSKLHVSSPSAPSTRPMPRLPVSASKTVDVTSMSSILHPAQRSTIWTWTDLPRYEMVAVMGMSAEMASVSEKKASEEKGRKDEDERQSSPTTQLRRPSPPMRAVPLEDGTSTSLVRERRPGAQGPQMGCRGHKV